MYVKRVSMIAAIAAIVLLPWGCALKLEVRSLTPAPPSDTKTGLNPDEYWDLIEETVPSPDAPVPQLKHSQIWFRNQLPLKGFAYVYGGKTAYKVQRGASAEYTGVLSCYFDNEDYSGVTIALGKGNSVDLDPLRNAKAAGVGFWAKGADGTETVYIGLLDDESDGKKVQTKVSLRDFGKLDTAWSYFMIPLKRFQSKGKYWDATKKTEILADVNWHLINELRFSTNRGENHGVRGKPIRLYIGHLSIIDEIPGYKDPQEYWAAFSSQAPDLLLHDFETERADSWQTGMGPASQVKFELVPVTAPGCATKALAITYQLNDWCDVMYDYRRNGRSDKDRNWTGYWGVKLMVYCEKSYQLLNLQVSDAGDELYIASCGAQAGWSEIIVPFKDFYKFPYYQPPDARHDGTFDLDNVIMLDIKPAGEGTSGTFMVDNMTLTNDRTVKSAAVAAKREAAVTGDFGTAVTRNINDGIFGINALHWDGDLLLPKTADYVKAIKHTVIRFPGGLSSDEYHWEKILAAKDENVDIDEFLDFCRKTGCEPMITVNFGTGTADEAAQWVRYVNIERKAGVRYWEIGNELYGNWHKNQCSAEEYGKRAAQFIAAMKRVDPSILVTVVWELENPWNKTVFEYTKEIADGVNVHHYPQLSGQENDAALLAAPQSLEGIIGRVRKQLRAYGAPDKTYQLWLTEWNSVNNDPGPQSLGMVNALFAADYLGMLAKLNIDQASYWNIHNSMFVQGGDYGYLSRSDVPEGPNVPRPSYWAFKLARENLRGALVKCSSSDINVSAYANKHPDGSKSLLIINKYPQTAVSVTIDLPGFEGNATELRLPGDSGASGFSTRSMKLKTGMRYDVPPYSITALRIE